MRYFFNMAKSNLRQFLAVCNWSKWHVQLWSDRFILNLFLGVLLKWFPKNKFHLEFAFQKYYNSKRAIMLIK